MTGESSDAGLRKPGETTVTGLWVPICATRHAVISIVVPTYQEAENLPHVTKAVADAFSDRASSYEILFVDDDSGGLDWARWDSASGWVVQPDEAGDGPRPTESDGEPIPHGGRFLELDRVSVGSILGIVNPL